MSLPPPLPQAGGQLTIECEVTKDDVVEFNQYHNRHSPFGRQQYSRMLFRFPAVWLLVFAVIWFFSSQQSGTPLQSFLELSPLLYGLIFYLLYAPFAFRRAIQRAVNGMLEEGKRSGLLGRHRITLTPESVVEATEFSQASTSWRAVEGVVEFGNHVFIYNTAMSAIVVPRRGFAAQSEFNKFVSTASSYREKAAT
ncbi:MAG: hypothetical protein RL514_407 [Verrucomicrobiota bacterium]|jgi:FtsH-binding integral membrane protein